MPIYGKGLNTREWIHVEDHCEGLLKIYKKGKSGESYNIGTGININNLNLTKILLKIINQKRIVIGKKVKITFVKDRPGHDLRYALNSKKIKKISMETEKKLLGYETLIILLITNFLIHIKKVL